jgi:hypothetical protein
MRTVAEEHVKLRKGRRTTVITFHEIKMVLERMAVMSGYVAQLGLLLPQVTQLAEKISRLDEDLTLQRDKMTAKMRSVELLGEIVKSQIYQKTGDGGLNSGLGTIDISNDISATPPNAMIDNEGMTCDSKSMVKEGNTGYLTPKINGSSLLF